MTDQPVRDTGYAPERWAFDDEVTRVFEDMLRRSIPDFDTMRELVFRVGRNYVNRDDRVVVDLGCSAGGSLAPFVASGVHAIGIDESGPMIEKARERFGDDTEGEARRAWIIEHDLRTGLPSFEEVAFGLADVKPDLILAVLTLMFIPMDVRGQLVRECWSSLPTNGAMIVVEKMLGPDPETDQMFVNGYYEMKRDHGYSDDEIERKRLSLQNVLIPLTAQANEDLLRSAGFSRVVPIWRWLNFGAWLAVKD
jgi:tRNA (cmo5U34)-methyltransferase